MAKFFIVLLVSYIFCFSVNAKQEPIFTNEDILKINENTVSFINNLNISDTVFKTHNEINKTMYNDCFIFNQRNRGYLPVSYINNRCLYNYVYKNSFKEGFEKSLKDNNKSSVFIDKVYQLVMLQDDYPEELTYFNYVYKYPFDINDDWVQRCKMIRDPNSPELSKCLVSIYRTNGNIGFADGYRKYMLVCDDFYPSNNLGDSNHCIVNLVNKSNNPFERIQTNCMLHNYYLINLKGNIKRKLNDNKFYECLSKPENNTYISSLWQSQKGFEYGYSLGLYIAKNKLFTYLNTE
ncbi:TPA: hypothetical protein NV714_000115 [Escherichia coli]|nr:hypothetical protein [Escherichia coli]